MITYNPYELLQQNDLIPAPLINNIADKIRKSENKIDDMWNEIEAESKTLFCYDITNTLKVLKKTL